MGIRSTDNVATAMAQEHKIKSELIERTLSWNQQREVAGIRPRRQNEFGASWLVVARKVP